MCLSNIGINLDNLVLRRIFAIENEAIHNKDYSVVKTSRAGLRTRSFCLFSNHNPFEM